MATPIRFHGPCCKTGNGGGAICVLSCRIEATLLCYPPLLLRGRQMCPNRCEGIAMRDVRLRYRPPEGEEKQPAESVCRNAQGVAFGENDPPSCLTE
uniref:Uncharacterized protein n=1 Tax=Oryza brachyantha TaxID=4533 RepID=J3N782_ORYBR